MCILWKLTRLYTMLTDSSNDKLLQYILCSELLTYIFVAEAKLFEKIKRTSEKSKRCRLHERLNLCVWHRKNVTLNDPFTFFFPLDVDSHFVWWINVCGRYNEKRRETFVATTHFQSAAKSQMTFSHSMINSRKKVEKTRK